MLNKAVGARVRPGKSGRRWAHASLLCAVWSVFLAPAVFGLLGIVGGIVAVWKGDKWWGAAGVSGNTVAALIGYSWAARILV